MRPVDTFCVMELSKTREIIGKFISFFTSFVPVYLFFYSKSTETGLLVLLENFTDYEYNISIKRKER